MKVTKTKNVVKDIPRGTANCDVLQESSENSSHVKRVTPLQTKIKEFAASQAERLGTDLAPDIDKVREGRTTRLRRAKDVRPL
jgi:hypothetical protein